VSTRLHFVLQRNDHSVESLAKEQLGQCRNLMESQTVLDPGKPLPSVFLKDQEEGSTQGERLWI